MLERFDVVLIMETMSDAGGTASLQHGLGWGGVTVERHVAGKQQKQKLSLEALPEADRAVLEANNVLDTELYAYARELHALDTEFYAPWVGTARSAAQAHQGGAALRQALRLGVPARLEGLERPVRRGRARHVNPRSRRRRM